MAVRGLAHQGAAGVALAGVYPPGCAAGTNDVVADAVHVVAAEAVADDGESDVAEVVD